MVFARLETGFSRRSSHIHIKVAGVFSNSRQVLGFYKIALIVGGNYARIILKSVAGIFFEHMNI
jgi:hypothetical protein